MRPYSAYWVRFIWSTLFFPNKFHAYDDRVTEAMKGASPILTKDTTMWKAWVGFNASHSLGAMMFAVFYILLAKNYWFKIPFTGILIATICFSVSAVLVYF